MGGIAHSAGRSVRYGRRGRGGPGASRALASCSGAECRESDGGSRLLDEKHTTVCRNIVSQVANITDGQNAATAAIAIASAGRNSEAAVEVTQSQGVSVSQVDQCVDAIRASVGWYAHVGAQGQAWWHERFSHPADYWLRRYLWGD